ncbi:hypothetical protein CBM2608_A50028 [Cupriavidus taiwanensis]|nr:hypothetical protein CBM2608_A50028 [Cupriavidus taiwanensis]
MILEITAALSLQPFACRFAAHAPQADRTLTRVVKLTCRIRSPGGGDFPRGQVTALALRFRHKLRLLLGLARA